MTDTYRTRVQSYAHDVITLIREDMASGKVAASVRGFPDLHDYVDANEYLIQVGLPWGTDGAYLLNNAVSDEVDHWLRTRVPTYTATRTLADADPQTRTGFITPANAWKWMADTLETEEHRAHMDNDAPFDPYSVALGKLDEMAHGDGRCGSIIDGGTGATYLVTETCD